MDCYKSSNLTDTDLENILMSAMEGSNNVNEE
jgi:hypothetical protein